MDVKDVCVSFIPCVWSDATQCFSHFASPMTFCVDCACKHHVVDPGYGNPEYLALVYAGPTGQTHRVTDVKTKQAQS